MDEKVVNEKLNELSSLILNMTKKDEMYEVSEYIVEGVVLKKFKNAPKNFPEMINTSRKFAESSIFYYEGEVWTYRDLFKQVDEICFKMRCVFGVNKGDRVAIAMRNYPEWISVFIASVNIGAVAVPINSWGKSKELIHVLKDVEPKLLFCDYQRYTYLLDFLQQEKSIKAIVVRSDFADNNVESAISLEKFLLNAVEVHEEGLDITPSDIAMIMYSSGTTGLPKGVVWTHQNLTQTMFNFQFLSELIKRQEKNRLSGFLKTGFGPTNLLAVPLFHANGLCSNTLSAILNGQKIVFMYKWNVSKALDLICSQRITRVGLSPSMTLELLSAPEFEKTDTSSIFFLAPGGSAQPGNLIKLIRDKCPGAVAGSGYGTTETGGAVSAIFGELYKDYPSSSGYVSPIYDVKICGSNGEKLNDGEAGEILVRGAAVSTLGYWNNSDATKNAFVDSWYHTGDIGYFDKRGLLYITDRIKDMVIRGGENIYCVEVENAMYEDPDILEVAVFGVPHEVLGEELAAAVRLKESSVFNPNLIRARLESRIAGYKVPKYIFLVDRLPRNAIGKVLKRELRDRMTSC